MHHELQGEADDTQRQGALEVRPTIEHHRPDDDITIRTDPGHEREQTPKNPRLFPYLSHLPDPPLESVPLPFDPDGSPESPAEPELSRLDPFLPLPEPIRRFFCLSDPATVPPPTPSPLPGPAPGIPWLISPLEPLPVPPIPTGPSATSIRSNKADVALSLA